MKAVLYFTFAGIVFIFGVITGFSIGIPFLFLGVLLAGLYSVLGKPVFWVVLSAYMLFWVGFILVAPLQCTSEAVSKVTTIGSFVSEGTERVSCTNLLGIEYSGAMGYSPPRGLAVVAGLVCGSAGGGVAWVAASKVFEESQLCSSGELNSGRPSKGVEASA